MATGEGVVLAAAVAGSVSILVTVANGWWLSARLKKLEQGGAMRQAILRERQKQAEDGVASYLRTLVEVKQEADRLIQSVYEGRGETREFREVQERSRQLELTLAGIPLVPEALPRYARELDSWAFALLWEIREEGHKSLDEDWAGEQSSTVIRLVSVATNDAKTWQLELRDEATKFAASAAAGR